MRWVSLIRITLENIISMTSLSLQTRLSTTMSWRSVLMTHGSPILTALSSTPNPVLVSAQATGITDGDATTAEWFNKTFGTQITVVPVDGASDSRGMFLSGDTDIFFASISDVMASYQSGEMKVACIFSDERSDFIPDVPTIKEATGEDFVAFAARGYFYPNGVPQDIVDTTTDALLKAMEDPDYIENMAALGLQLDNTSGEDFKELLESQVETRKMIWNVQ